MVGAASAGDGGAPSSVPAYARRREYDGDGAGARGGAASTHAARTRSASRHARVERDDGDAKPGDVAITNAATGAFTLTKAAAPSSLTAPTCHRPFAGQGAHYTTLSPSARRRENAQFRTGALFETYSDERPTNARPLAGCTGQISGLVGRLKFRRRRLPTE
jgi:hypothetical protein